MLLWHKTCYLNSTKCCIDFLIYLGRLSMMKTVEMSNSILVIEYWIRMDKMFRYCSFSSKEMSTKKNDWIFTILDGYSKVEETSKSFLNFSFAPTQQRMLNQLLYPRNFFLLKSKAMSSFNLLKNCVSQHENSANITFPNADQRRLWILVLRALYI